MLIAWFQSHFSLAGQRTSYRAYPRHIYHFASRTIRTQHYDQKPNSDPGCENDRCRGGRSQSPPLSTRKQHGGGQTDQKRNEAKQRQSWSKPQDGVCDRNNRNGLGSYKGYGSNHLQDIPSLSNWYWSRPITPTCNDTHLGQGASAVFNRLSVGILHLSDHIPLAANACVNVHHCEAARR
jgi:hypothetical protein